MTKAFNGALVIREQSDRVFYEAKWRDSRGRQVKRRVGPAWVERDGAGRWQRRGGRVPDGCFDHKAAIVEMSRLIDVREAELAAGPPPGEITFDQIAADWLRHVEHVDGIKPSTLSSYRYILRPPGASARKRGRRKAGGRVLAEFGGQPIATITTAQVERWLARLDAEPISKRTIKYPPARSSARCSSTPCAARTTTASRRTWPAQRRNAASPNPAVLGFYEPEEVAALARAHRDSWRPAISDAERDERRRADDQDAALVVVAAFTGLRMGELLELRWRYVSFERATVTSRRPGAAARSSRPSRANRAPCPSRRHPRPSSRASPSAAGSRAPTTSCSAARSATTSTPPHSAAGCAAPGRRRTPAPALP